VNVVTVRQSARTGSATLHDLRLTLAESDQRLDRLTRTTTNSTFQTSPRTPYLTEKRANGVPKAYRDEGEDAI
jgi:hypothetical protein